MKVVCETERLVLREFAEEDAQFAFELNSDPDVMRYTGDQAFKSLEEARIFLQNYTDYKRNGYGRWLVQLRSNCEPIGWCGLKLHEDGTVDLGYRFKKEFWGKGYATEAARSCLIYGFKALNIKEIVARILPQNEASIALALRLNMKFWKTGECEGWNDTHYYRIGSNKVS